MKRFHLRVVLLAGLALALVLVSESILAQGRSEKLSAADLAKIRAVSEAYADAWLKNDAEAVLNTLSEDAVLIPQGNRPVVGIEAIKKFWWPPDGGRTTIKSFTISTDEVGGDGGVGYVRGTFQFSFSYEEKGKTTELTNAGNYMMIMKRRADGSWRISHRMWGDLPRK
ncbi:MAG TPA: SgcJ/EcaC family oxidoreductase [Pyrinomonadaceae bacterium]|nr:SgcJ/EcaC family oxidoreductase [Pyrinomonadaceae bacterium]